MNRALTNAMNRFNLPQVELTSHGLSFSWPIHKALEPARPRAVVAARALKAPPATRKEVLLSTPAGLTAAFET